MKTTRNFVQMPWILFLWLNCGDWLVGASIGASIGASHRQLSSRYEILPSSSRGNLQRQIDESLPEEDISFDGTNLEEIKNMALLKAEGETSNISTTTSPVSSFCNMTSTTTIHVFRLDFGYTVEYFPATNVSQMVKKLELVLEEQLSSRILQCHNSSAAGAEIIGHSASPDDVSIDGVCVPDNLVNSCTGYNGRINIFLTSFLAENTARNWTIAAISQVFNETGFVIQVGMGLVSVKMGLSTVVAVNDAGGSNRIVAGDGNMGFFSTSSFAVVSAAGGATLILAALLFAYRRSCKNNKSFTEEVSTRAPEPPGSSIQSGELSSSSGDEESPFSYGSDGIDSDIFRARSAQSLSIVYECESYLEASIMMTGSGDTRDMQDVYNNNLFVQTGSDECSSRISQMATIGDDGVSPMSLGYTGSPPSFESTEMDTPEMLGICKREDDRNQGEMGLQSLINVYGAPSSTPSHPEQNSMVLGINKPC